MPSRAPQILGILFCCLLSPLAQAREFCAELYSPTPAMTLASELRRLADEYAERKSPAEREMTEELFDSGSRRLLETTGVRFRTERINDYETLVISTRGTSELNRFAAEMDKRFNALVVFAPRSYLREDAAAFVDALEMPRGATRPILGLGGDHVLHASSPSLRRDIILLHEIQHLQFGRELRERRDSPFHGAIYNRDGKLLSKISPHEETYARFLSFEEVKTFHRELKMWLVELGSLRKASNYAENLEVARDRAELLEAVAARSVLAAQAGREALLSGNAALRFSILPSSQGPVTVARLWQRRAKEARWVLEIPLLRSLGREDQNNKTLLLERLDLLEHRASRALEQARAARKSLAAFPAQRESMDAARIDLLQSLLNPAALERDAAP